MRPPSHQDEVPLSRKVDVLRRPSSYREDTGPIEAIETHMSWVFLTSLHAYKLKKPVSTEFLDFSTIEARHLDCQRELELNRRLAHDVYLGIVPLTRTETGLELAGDGAVVDWLVEMRRVPRDLMLEEKIEHGTLTEVDVRAFSLLLAQFYHRSEPALTEPTAYLDLLEGEVRSNTKRLERFDSQLPAGVVPTLEKQQLRFLADHRHLLGERVREGRIIDGHGDLRPEHICLEPRPVIIDCLEFNRSLRILDAADELSFLALECERLGGPEVGPRVLLVYEGETGDWVPPPFVHFYETYRACIRARLSLVHADEPGHRGADHWIDRGRDYLILAATHADGFRG